MVYDFDKIIDRKHTNCIKYDFTEEFHRPSDVMPLWVADMDFQAPEEVREALKRAAEHGIYGYTDTKKDYNDTVIRWFEEGFSWKPEAEWMIKMPGVVFALAMAVQALTRPGEGVLIQPPVYHPFSASVENNGRKLVENPLIYKDGKYEMDFEDFENKIRDNAVKLFILCSPHNPVGRVWKKEELMRVGEICQKYGVIVVSDEIHCDFTFEGHEHTVYASLGEAFASHAIICTAPSKTFNIAGLQASNIFIPNPEIRSAVKQAMTATGYSSLNQMGIYAAQAAYTYGRPWLEALKKYLAENVSLVREFLKREMPEVRLVEPEGTYLIWLDFSGLGFSDDELNKRIQERAGIWLNRGTMFGAEGAGFQRVNIACPKKILKEALERLKNIR